MALGDDYGTLSVLKSRLSISDNEDDTQLQNALSTATKSVEHFCRRQFNKTTTATARVFNPRSWWLAEVDDFHTTTDLEVATDLGDSGTFSTTWSTSDFQLEPLSGVVNSQEVWPFWKIRAVEAKYFPQLRRAGLQVTAQWGWDAVPAPVTEATLILAEETFKLKDAPFGIAGFGDFGMVQIRQNPKVAQMLMPYRRDPILVA